MRRLLIVLLCCFSTLLLAQQEMEIIPLQHRTVDQVLPTLLPFVEPGGALSGMNNQLILRGSAKNRAQIKQALVAIDTPPRRLIIRVSQNRGGEGRQQAAEASLSVGTQRGDASLNARTVDTRSVRDARTAQSVQVVEGARALIQVGQSLPLPLHQVVLGPKGVTMSDSVVYRDMGQGFYAVPRLAGDRVTLEISPQSDAALNPASGGNVAINTQRLSTTVSGRLGEWIELGGSSQQESGSVHGQWSAGTSELRDRRSLWLQVEELP